jgi:hypothetical protein
MRKIRAYLIAVGILTVTLLNCTVPTVSLSVPWLPRPRPPQIWVTAPGSPTPFPEPELLPYLDSSAGISLWYPSDWVYAEFVDQVVFATSEQIIAGTELYSGAAMMLSRIDLAHSETVGDLVGEALAELPFSRPSKDGPIECTIGGERGMLVRLEGRPAGADVLMKGFAAAVEHDGTGYLFVAASILDEWPQLGPALESMLNSVEFYHDEPGYSSDSLGFEITYPHGWVVEEQGEMVIFASSQAVIAGAELENGAAMVVIAQRLGDGESVVDMAEMIMSDLSSDDFVTGSSNPTTVGGQEGISIAFSGTPEAYTSVRGFVVALEHEGWGHLFIALSGAGEWCFYESVLDEMLGTVQFTGQ